jgi:hypothetical protein
MKNWKTTLSGIASIISGVALFLNKPEQVVEAVGLVSLGFGLIFAKDHNVTGGAQSLGGTNPPHKKDEK